MTAKETRQLTPAEIIAKLRETREQLLQMRLRKHTGQVEKTHELRSLRKDVARMETILLQKNTPSSKPAKAGQNAPAAA